jgi:threonine dehydrogenase-like Zn-dependent dehydrogenase
MAIPETMRAAVLRGKGELVVEDVPVPELGPNEVLLEVSHCGVCGSDLHMVVEGWGRPGSIGGHEFTGVVAALGEDVKGWSVGDEAVGGPSVRCGECEPCLAGRPSLCMTRDTPGMNPWQGAFARYIRVEDGELLRLPTGLSIRAAALAEPLAVALHGITLSRIEPGQRALVTGAGPIGALVIAALHAKGFDDVTVSEPSPVRRELAARLGASKVIAPDALEAPSRMDPGRVAPDAFHVAFECSGKGVAMEAALGQLRRGGTLVLVGAGMDTPRFDPNRILLNELVITGAFTYDADGFDVALDLLASGRIPTDELIEPEDVGLDQLPMTMERLAAGEIAGKVMVVP